MMAVIDLESALLSAREKNQAETEEMTKKYKEKVKELSYEAINQKDAEISDGFLSEKDIEQLMKEVTTVTTSTKKLTKYIFLKQKRVICISLGYFLSKMHLPS